MPLHPSPTNGSTASLPNNHGASRAEEAQTDVPFLVTHWLANYDGGGANTVNTAEDPKKKEAIDRIRNATSEIASAFASLGAYGSTIRPSFGASFLHQSLPQNAMYSDVSRRWSGLPSSHLEHLAQAVTTSNSIAEVTATNSSHINLLQAAGETREQRDGRTIQDVITIDVPSKEEASGETGLSILHAPVLISSVSGKHPMAAAQEAKANAGRSASSSPMLQVQSSYADAAQKTAEVMRQFLVFREQSQSTAVEIKSLETSVAKQMETQAALGARFQQIGHDATIMGTQKLEIFDEIKAGKLECERVIAQLERKLLDLNKGHEITADELARLAAEAQTSESKRRLIVKSFRDPFDTSRGPLPKGHRIGGNIVLQTLLGRQQGLSRSRLKPLPSRSQILDGPKPTHFSATRKTLLCTRLSHAATINTHLSYPVYCLRFDRTGRYFVTGADDYLIKVFCLGAGQSSRNKNDLDGSRLLRCNYGANIRGAVHVCSLRGHAGVINDIDVSSDNCFLATASVDGDVRVWGLKDGCPVAILRGHKGGANMVSWSTLTPYRLVSTGSDGYARIWDIREACLKRYGAFVGRRQEYRLHLTDSEKKAEKEREDKNTEQGSPESLLPPLPVREGALAAQAVVVPVPNAPPSHQANSMADAAAHGGLVVPPLPAAVPPLPGAGNAVAQNGGQNINAPGQFVANDLMDEGVKLLSKYKHGATGEELTGPGTRARRAAVNVICVSRCPLGGHFATGSDDGICRVWKDIEEGGVAVVDRRVGDNIYPRIRVAGTTQTKLRSARSDGDPLLRLMGHVSAITDLAYSHVGDKILSASQKEGVIRIWSVGTKLSINTAEVGVGKRGVSQIVIKLKNPGSSLKSQSKSTRRGPGSSARTETSKVSCDVAVWTHDDSRIVTSQSVLVKQNGSDIEPGSQFLFLWDSSSGQCLMGISGAHTMQCPVVIPHPSDSAIVCTAAADGIAKVWDWETGRCVFTYRNKVEFGPVEASERNKLAGYLDGAFSPDGTTIVLTDDSGRITILDSAGATEGSESNSALAWMREQYFANDYYDLYFDQNGYCIERGSERPPHLAPRGVRCNHAGSPWSDDVNEVFRKLIGPMPLPEQTCRWGRERIRAQGRHAVMDKTVVNEGPKTKVRIGVREFDPVSTIVIKAAGHVDVRNKESTSVRSQHPVGNSSRESSDRNDSRENASGALSANFRYLDYDDMIRMQGAPDEGDLDSDDEEFEPTARNSEVVDNSGDSADDMDLDGGEAESPFRPSRRRNNAASGQRQQRAQRRAQRNRDSQFVEIGSDDEMVAQYMSTNNTPSGPYLRDYISAGHFWRKTGGGRVRRRWLRRAESDSSYDGRKTYTPQLGDSVVYVPRAHFETINAFPSLTPPWQHWPQGTAWPVVRCCIRGIRFRFPYEDYFRGSQSMCTSVVAILTLEITGIPELGDREFPWPKPSFVESTRPYTFELSLFENDKCEFLIPEGQYTERLLSLERALRSRTAPARGLEVNLYYENASRAEDSDMEVFPATIEGFQEGETHADPHLNGSGFGVVDVDCQNYNDNFSPWELLTEGTTISRPMLSEEEKKLVLENLNAQLRRDGVTQHLGMPVDQVRYSDYSSMVEVEMNLMFVKRRLESNYYSSKLSVVSDVRLIRDNCIKYNTSQNDLSRIANEMCDEFETKVLSSEERAVIISEEEFDLIANQGSSRPTPTVRLRLRQRNNQSANTNQASSETTYSLRGRARTQRQSSLESLPRPQAPANRRGRELRNDFETTTVQRRSTRSRDPAPDTEVLGRISRSRTRSLGTEQQQASNEHGRETRASANRNRSNRDVASGEDADDADESRDESRPVDRPTRRSGRGRPLRSSARADYTYGEEDDYDDEGPTRRSNRRRPDRQSANGENNHGQTISNNRRRSGRSSAAAGDNDIEDDEVLQSPIRRARGSSGGTRSSTRQTTRTNSRNRCASEEESRSSSSEESGSDSHVSDDVDVMDPVDHRETPPARRKRSSTSNTHQQAVRTSPRAKRRVVSCPAEDSPTRRSSRAAAKTHASYEEVPSDNVLEEEESDSSDEEAVTSIDRSKKVSSYGELPSDYEEEEEVVTSNGRSKKVRSYVELPSDYDEEEEDVSDEDVSDEEGKPAKRMSRVSKKRGEDYEEEGDSSDEEETPARRTSRASKKRGQDYEEEEEEDFSDEEETPARRTTRTSKKRGPEAIKSLPPASKRPKVILLEMPELSQWPDIGVKDITRVAKVVIAKLEESDTQRVFRIPVLESYPELANSYLRLVETPMDLRTIDEEQVCTYESIQELQEDLILMFQNCCKFNAKGSLIWNYTIGVWAKANAIFKAACEETDVLLPRRWQL